MAETEFFGTYSHNIDPKGRATIPAVYREPLGERFTLGLNSQFNALALYPEKVWNDISERLSRIPISDIDGMNYVRLIKAFSFPNQQLDAQGRLLLPATLRQKAGMDRAICFAGVGEYLEIWDEGRFMATCAQAEADIDKLLHYVNDRYFSPEA